MPMRQAKTLVALIAALMALAPIAAAQSDAASETRDYETALGSVSMPRETTADASGEADITADVVLDVSAAESAGAKWILVSVGNDNATDLTMTLGSLDGAEAASTEGEATKRAQWWLDTSTLGDEASLTLTATAKSGDALYDVETVIMAFDASYSEVETTSGEPLYVQSWTTVTNEGGDATFQGNESDDNLTDDNLTDDNLTDNTSDNTTDNESEAGEQIPGPAILVALGAIGVAAVAVSLGRRNA